MQAQEDGADAQQEFADMMKHVGFNTNLEMDQVYCRIKSVLQTIGLLAFYHCSPCTFLPGMSI